jgi:nicotinate-nucleotide pyrophosphorylase (carboxylating)
MNKMVLKSLLPQIRTWLDEDDLARNFMYTRSLPTHLVQPCLKVKSDLLLAGSEYFAAVFYELGFEENFEFLTKLEGLQLSPCSIEFPFGVPFNIALTAERLALNLIHHASSIATWTRLHVDKLNDPSIVILDTRKTTPGLRSLEKYAVRVGRGGNHRFGQTDAFMIKDNHKVCMGGLASAVDFLRSLGSFYNNIVVEIHSLEELNEAFAIGCKHLLLDNFTIEQLSEAIRMKPPGVTYEVSGGLSLDLLNAKNFQGVDAISLGALTQSAPRVDLSLKMSRL